jgi:hypothetical protein
MIVEAFILQMLVIWPNGEVKDITLPYARFFEQEADCRFYADVRNKLIHRPVEDIEKDAKLAVKNKTYKIHVSPMLVYSCEAAFLHKADEYNVGR